MKVWLIRFRGVETPIESVLSEQINRCCVRSEPFPQFSEPAGQYLSHPQQSRSGCFGCTGNCRNENIFKQFPSIDALEPLTVNAPNAINAVHMATQRPTVSDLLHGHFAADFSCQPCSPLHC